MYKDILGNIIKCIQGLPKSELSYLYKIYQMVLDCSGIDMKDLDYSNRLHHNHIQINLYKSL